MHQLVVIINRPQLLLLGSAFAMSFNCHPTALHGHHIGRKWQYLCLTRTQRHFSHRNTIQRRVNMDAMQHLYSIGDWCLNKRWKYYMERDGKVLQCRFSKAFKWRCRLRVLCANPAATRNVCLSVTSASRPRSIRDIVHVRTYLCVLDWLWPQVKPLFINTIDIYYWLWSIQCMQ